MPIDPSIALQVRPPQFENPLDSLGRVLTLKQLSQQSELSKLALESQRTEAADTTAINQQMKTSGGDVSKLKPQNLNQQKLIAQIKAELEKYDEQKLKTYSADLDHRHKTHEAISTALNGVADQAGWDTMLGTFANSGDPYLTKAAQSMGTVYDPKVKKQFQLSGINAKDVLDMERQAAQDELTTREKNLPKKLHEFTDADSKPVLVMQNPQTGGLSLVGADGTPYTGAGKVKGSTNLQSKEIVGPDGKTPAFANFDPETGKYYDPKSGKEMANAAPYQRPQDPSIAALRDLQATVTRMQLEGGGLTPSQRANEIGTMRTSWTKLTQPVLERRQSIAKVDTALSAITKGNFKDSTQIIITAFNKLLDEGSVVREGEYARSEEGQALMDRIRGSIEKLSRGGSQLTEKDLRATAAEAKNIAGELEKQTSAFLEDTRQGIEETLDDYKIPHSRVFGSSGIGKRATKPTSAETPKAGIVIDPDGGEHVVSDVDAAIKLHPGTKVKPQAKPNE